MKKLVLPALLLGITTLTASVETLAATEASFETSTRHVPVPLTPNSDLLLSNCSTCDKVTVRVAPTTRYFVGDREVKLKELREYVATRPALLSCIYYTTPGRTVTRFVVAKLEP
jgi:hypothetical protein